MAKYNLNRQSLGGIIGQQKLNAQRAKLQLGQFAANGQGLMPNIQEGGTESNMPAVAPKTAAQNTQHISMKHRQSFKQTTNLTNQLMVLNDGSSSPQNNQAQTIMGRRAGS